jgi:hypothetical protein
LTPVCGPGWIDLCASSPRSWSPRWALAGGTIPAPPGEGPLRDLLHEQADYFLYFMMDLAHAAR